jgi:hypothetical protein
VAVTVARCWWYERVTVVNENIAGELAPLRAELDAFDPNFMGPGDVSRVNSLMGQINRIVAEGGTVRYRYQPIDMPAFGMDVLPAIGDTFIYQDQDRVAELKVIARRYMWPQRGSRSWLDKEGPTVHLIAEEVLGLFAEEADEVPDEEEDG